MDPVEAAFGKWKRAHDDFVAAERKLADAVARRIRFDSEALQYDVKVKRCASDSLLEDAMRLLRAHAAIPH